MVSEFSPDGKLLAIGVKQKAAPATNLAVMQWPGGPFASLPTKPIQGILERECVEPGWPVPLCDPLDRDRRLGYLPHRCSTGASQRLFEHTGKQLISIADVSRDGRTLLVTSNANGGYENAALLDLATKKLRWLTDTQWSANGVAFTPDGGTQWWS